MAFVRILDPAKLQQLNEAGLLWLLDTEDQYLRPCGVNWKSQLQGWVFRCEPDYFIHFGIVTED